MCRRDPDGHVVWTMTQRHPIEYDKTVRVVQTTLRDRDWHLKICGSDKFPGAAVTDKVRSTENRIPHIWFGLEGSNTEWTNTLKSITRGGLVYSAAGFGHAMVNMAGRHLEIQPGTRSSKRIRTKQGFVLQRYKGAGPTGDRFGWRVLVRIPLESPEAEEDPGEEHE
jgi:hypothetical protein